MVVLCSGGRAVCSTVWLTVADRLRQKDAQIFLPERRHASPTLSMVELTVLGVWDDRLRQKDTQMFLPVRRHAPLELSIIVSSKSMSLSSCSGSNLSLFGGKT